MSHTQQTVPQLIHLLKSNNCAQIMCLKAPKMFILIISQNILKDYVCSHLVLYLIQGDPLGHTKQLPLLIRLAFCFAFGLVEGCILFNTLLVT